MNVTVHTSSYYCEGGGHAGNKLATDDNPVIRISTDVADTFRCARCLLDAVNKPATTASEGITINCRECGGEIDSDNAFCDAQCALMAGFDGGHECEGSCSNCGDTASYCSAGCAIADGGSNECANCTEAAAYCSADCAIACGDTLHCATCGKNRNATTECPDCRHKDDAPVALAAASSTTAVNDDGSIVVDGLTIQF